MKNIIEFIEQIDGPKMTSLERAHAILWWATRCDSITEMLASEICKIIEDAGHPKQNVSRLYGQLSTSVSVCKGIQKNTWRLRLQAKKKLDSIYETIIDLPPKIKLTDSILPRALFENTRTYLEKIIFQINGSYDSGFYDCCAVMCRRALETLIIEVYESAGKPNEIKGVDGNFFMFADLLRVLEKDTTFHLSRNCKQGLADFKKLGDLSAHNRRFNARKEDIDRIRDGIRIAGEELLHLAKFS